jgi:hypothetical protein
VGGRYGQEIPFLSHGQEVSHYIISTERLQKTENIFIYYTYPFCHVVFSFAYVCLVHPFNFFFLTSVIFFHVIFDISLFLHF